MFSDRRAQNKEEAAIEEPDRKAKGDEEFAQKLQQNWRHNHLTNPKMIFAENVIARKCNCIDTLFKTNFLSKSG